MFKDDLVHIINLPRDMKYCFACILFLNSNLPPAGNTAGKSVSIQMNLWKKQ